jgi:hypothetical protein
MASGLTGDHLHAYVCMHTSLGLAGGHVLGNPNAPKSKVQTQTNPANEPNVVRLFVLFC